MDPKHIPSKIIECAPVGPLSRYIEPYVTLHREQGYAPASLHEHVRVIVMFSQSLQRSGCEIRDLDEAVIERFLYHELKEQWPHISASSQKSGYHGDLAKVELDALRPLALPWLGGVK